MDRIVYADGSHREISQVIDIGKTVIEDVNRSQYEFHYPAASNTFDELRTIHSNPALMTHFDVARQAYLKNAAGEFVLGTDGKYIPKTDEAGNLIYEISPIPADAAGNNDGFLILTDMSFRHVEIQGANYDHPAVTEDRIVVTMAQRQYWEH